MVRVILYAEDPPTRDGVVATGLARVNRHIVAALGDSFAGGIAAWFPIRNSLDEQDLDPTFARRFEWAFRFEATPRYLMPLIKRMTGAYVPIPEYRNQAIVAKFSNSADLLFVPVGTNVQALSRAMSVAKRLKLPTVPYMVDDPEADAIVSRRRLASRLVARFRADLKCCAMTFCVTEGLAQLISQRYGVTTRVVSLPFATNRVCNEQSLSRSRDIVFVGNASHFYQDGLRQCAIAVRECQRRGFPTRLLCTVPGRFLEQLRVEFSDKVIGFCPCETDGELHRLLSCSLAAFAPYSFDQKYFPMITTSYPSKMTEYLAAAKHIIVYGPKTSTAATMMSKGHIPTVLTCESIDELVATFCRAFGQPHDHSALYRKLLDEIHGYSQFTAHFRDL